MANHALMNATVAVKVPASTVRWELLEHQYAVATRPATMNAEAPTRRIARWYTTAFDGRARYSSAIHGMRAIAPPPYTRSRRRLERRAPAPRPAGSSGPSRSTACSVNVAPDPAAPPATVTGWPTSDGSDVRPAPMTATDAGLALLASTNSGIFTLPSSARGLCAP